MKRKSLFGVIVLAMLAVSVFSMAACDGGGGGDVNAIDIASKSTDLISPDIVLELDDYTVQEVKKGDTVVAQTSYTVSGGVLAFATDYLTGLGAGTHRMTVVCEEGSGDFDLILTDDHKPDYTVATPDNYLADNNVVLPEAVKGEFSHQNIEVRYFLDGERLSEFTHELDAGVYEYSIKFFRNGIELIDSEVIKEITVLSAFDYYGRTMDSESFVDYFNPYDDPNGQQFPSIFEENSVAWDNAEKAYRFVNNITPADENYMHDYRGFMMDIDYLNKVRDAGYNTMTLSIKHDLKVAPDDYGSGIYGAFYELDEAEYSGGAPWDFRNPAFFIDSPDWTEVTFEIKETETSTLFFVMNGTDFLIKNVEFSVVPKKSVTYFQNIGDEGVDIAGIEMDIYAINGIVETLGLFYGAETAFHSDVIDAKGIFLNTPAQNAMSAVNMTDITNIDFFSSYKYKMAGPEGTTGFWVESPLTASVPDWIDSTGWVWLKIILRNIEGEPDEYTHSRLEIYFRREFDLRYELAFSGEGYNVVTSGIAGFMADNTYSSNSAIKYFNAAEVTTAYSDPDTELTYYQHTSLGFEMTFDANVKAQSSYFNILFNHENNTDSSSDIGVTGRMLHFGKFANIYNAGVNNTNRVEYSYETALKGRLGVTWNPPYNRNANGARFPMLMSGEAPTFINYGVRKVKIVYTNVARTSGEGDSIITLIRGNIKMYWHDGTDYVEVLNMWNAQLLGDGYCAIVYDPGLTTLSDVISNFTFTAYQS